MKRVLTAEFAGTVDLSFCPEGLEFVLRATLDAA